MASHRTASRYWSALVFLISVALIGGFAYYVHKQVGLDHVLQLPLQELGPILAGFGALLSFLSLLWVLVLLEYRNTDEQRRDEALKAELERLTAPGTEAAQHAAHIAADLRSQADALKASSTEAAVALDSTGTLFRQHSKDLADSANKLTAAVNLIKDAIAAQTGDLISISQNMGAQRASLVEAAKKETNALAEALNLSAQAIGTTVRSHGEQLSGLVGNAGSQGAALQAAVKQQSEQLKAIADKQTAEFAAAIDGLSKRIEAATQGAAKRSEEMKAAVETQAGVLSKSSTVALTQIKDSLADFETAMTKTIESGGQRAAVIRESLQQQTDAVGAALTGSFEKFRQALGNIGQVATTTAEQAAQRTKSLE